MHNDLIKYIREAGASCHTTYKSWLKKTAKNIHCLSLYKNQHAVHLMHIERGKLSQW